MKRENAASAQARQRLIRAALRLFAHRGVEAVSLRMINRDAGSRNNSALHYHFGSKLGLVAAIDEFIQGQFDRLREPRIAELEVRSESGERLAVAEVLQVFTYAYVEVIEGNEWGLDAVRTLARMEFDGDDEVQALRTESAKVATQRFAALLQPLLPHLAEQEFRQRFNFFCNAVINGFADYHNLHCSYLGDLSVAHLSELADFYVRIGSGLLEAP